MRNARSKQASFPRKNRRAGIADKNSNEYKTGDRDFNLGFCNVYPDHPFSQRVAGTTGLNDNAFPFIGQLRDRLRNGMSHIGFTKRTFDIHNSSKVEDDFTVFPVGSSPSDPAPIPFYVANPHRITRTIVDHFGKFIHDLRTSTDAELHEKFLEFVQDFHGPHSMEFPKFKFRRFQGGSRAAQRVKFPPANRSWRGAGGRDLRPKCHLPCSAEKLGELGDPGFQARLFWKRLWQFLLVADPPQGRQHVGKRWLFLLPVPRSEGKT